jgi:hypothetical protein
MAYLEGPPPPAATSRRGAALGHAARWIDRLFGLDLIDADEGSASIGHGGELSNPALSELRLIARS